MLENVKVVLVETSHPGNIGSVARAMKTMCLANLYLVAPKIFPSALSTARAAGADDILASATICDHLAEAIGDCHLVIGASARIRSIAWPLLTPRQCAQKIRDEGRDKNVAILFGREHSGLTNAEIDLCQYLLRIPCNADYSSLNLAAAVQIIAYELLLMSRDDAAASPEYTVPKANARELEAFYHHLHQILLAVDFIHPDKSRSIMRRLRRLFNRAHLEKKEIDILRGILSSVQNKLLAKESK